MKRILHPTQNRGCPILPRSWEGWETTKARVSLPSPLFSHQTATAFKNNRKRQSETTLNPESKLTPRHNAKTANPT